jgi:prophage regulatory protein
MEKGSETPGETLLRLPSVEARTSMKKSAIYAGVKAGTFPAPLKIGQRAAAWRLSEIEAWIADRIRASAKRVQK